MAKTLPTKECHLPHPSTLPQPPQYTSRDGFNAPSAKSSTSSLPRYDSIVPDTVSYEPAVSYQVETKGHSWCTFPLPPKPTPITIHAISPTGDIGHKVYESIRFERKSGNCQLFEASSGEPVCSTTYRIGPGKPPKIRILGGVHHHLAQESDAGESSRSAGDGEDIEVVGRGCTTRTVLMRTPFGSFQWRYANRSERKLAGADALLVLEQVKSTQEDGKTQETCRRVAQLVRNDEFRTAGSGRSTAGNGGRLTMDLREWDMAEDKGREAEQMERLVVASCLTMLKKEVDRRRFQQMMILAGGASGGS